MTVIPRVPFSRSRGSPRTAPPGLVPGHGPGCGQRLRHAAAWVRPEAGSRGGKVAAPHQKLLRRTSRSDRCLRQVRHRRASVHRPTLAWATSWTTAM